MLWYFIEQNSGVRSQNSGVRIQESEFRIQNEFCTAQRSPVVGRSRNSVHRWQIAPTASEYFRVAS
ncbi:hypothetical protein [Nostoc sp. NMS4]|uniref:hypothetical protein n=1 Tax=Nostoc sp. NMS4 TaxID=2815390 RepID=UPI0025EBCC5D|nr:hypothetical protein [Nostoc sp. NMS4]MBN3925771.1 hypothetical protein [Nostoc sp. NMS4]